MPLLAPCLSGWRRELFVCALIALFGNVCSAQENPQRLDSIIPLLDPAVKDTQQLNMLIRAAEAWTTSPNALLYLVGMDTLSLALLHDTRPRVVLFTVREGHVLLQRCDDGLGFNGYGTICTGHGMPNVEDRAERLGGPLSSRSGEGNGTIVRFVAEPQHTTL